MYLVLDIGATNLRIGYSTDGRALVRTVKTESPKKYRGLLASVQTGLRRLSLPGRPKVAVAGVPGSVYPDKRRLYRVPNSPDWSGRRLADDLKRITGVRTAEIENDALLAGLGEAVLGAGKKFSNVMYCTFSTGINHISIIGGRAVCGPWGFEAGHQIIDRPDTSLMDLASGAGIFRRFGRPAEKISDKTIWRKIEDDLAVGVYNSILHWSPQAVVCGGGLMQSLDVARLGKIVRRRLKIFADAPVFMKAKFGDSAGLYGAAICAGRLLKQRR